MADVFALAADEVLAAVGAAVEGSGAAVAVAVSGAGVGLAVGGRAWAVATGDPARVVRTVEDELRPRWIVWDQGTAAALVRLGVRVAACWDVAAAHRLLTGRWRFDPSVAWIRARDLDPATRPSDGPVDLFSAADHDAGDSEDPVRPDGHLRPDWLAGAWAERPERVARWARLAAEVAAAQQAEVEALATERPAAPRTVRSESSAELLCAELTADGLPVDRAVAEATLTELVGPRPRSEREAADQRAERDAEVLRHVPPGGSFDLRSPGQVKSLLRFVGIEVPDTRAWRLEAHRDDHPLVDALLRWRKAERMATAFGYGWLDGHVDADGRLRGEWSASDGAAGRMTASAGLHNLPAELRPAVRAEPGHVFVRADLGQIEPRVLAAVSGDPALIAATVDDDLYAPVAERLQVERATAKVAVLGAMYGQTTGHGAEAMRGLRAAYPVAIEHLESAARQAEGGQDLRTYGGRLVRMGPAAVEGISERDARSRAAARGRYGRNAVVQGAAAELFKVWALVVRARAAEHGARIVLCLHDELLVHVPEAAGEAVAEVVDRALEEAAHRWCPGSGVRFVSDTSVLACWADAKG